jgi:hypothetical protein
MRTDNAGQFVVECEDGPIHRIAGRFTAGRSSGGVSNTAGVQNVQSTTGENQSALSAAAVAGSVNGDNPNIAGSDRVQAIARSDRVFAASCPNSRLESDRSANYAGNIDVLLAADYLGQCDLRLDDIEDISTLTAKRELDSLLGEIRLGKFVASEEADAAVDYLFDQIGCRS